MSFDQKLADLIDPIMSLPASDWRDVAAAVAMSPSDMAEVLATSPQELRGPIQAALDDYKSEVRREAEVWVQILGACSGALTVDEWEAAFSLYPIAPHGQLEGAAVNHLANIGRGYLAAELSRVQLLGSPGSLQKTGGLGPRDLRRKKGSAVSLAVRPGLKLTDEQWQRLIKMLASSVGGGRVTISTDSGPLHFHVQYPATAAINDPVVTASLDNLQARGLTDTAHALRELAKAVDASRNPEAAENFNQLAAELAKSKPRQSLVKTFWDGLATALPAVTQMTEIVKIIEAL